MYDLGTDIDGKFVFEATTDPMAVVDTAAERVQISTVNSAFEYRFNCEQTALDGTDLTAIVGEATEEPLQSRIQPGVEVAEMVDLAGTDGDSLLRVRPLGSEGSDTRSLVVITARPDESRVAPVGADRTAGD